MNKYDYIRARQCSDINVCMTVERLSDSFQWETGRCVFYTPVKKCKLDSPWIVPYLVVSLIGWAIGIQKAPESPIVIVHCQDIKKIPPPPGAVSWLNTKEVSCTLSVMILGASTMQRTLPSSLSLTVAPPVEETLIAEVESNHSVGSSIVPAIFHEWMLRLPL